MPASLTVLTVCPWCEQPSDANDPEELCANCREFVEDMFSGEANAVAADAMAEAIARRAES